MSSDARACPIKERALMATATGTAPVTIALKNGRTRLADIVLARD